MQNEKHRRGFKGIWIPKEIWLSDLSLQEKVFIAEIDSLDNTDSGCYASNSYFADFFKISKARCSQVISQLEKKELIKIEMLMKNKQVVQRKITIAKGVVNILKGGSKYSKGGSKFLHSIYNSNNNTKNITEIDKSISVRPKKENNKSSCLNESNNSKYYKLAIKLSKIIKTKKNIEHTSIQIKAWSEEFRKLDTVNKVSLKRQKEILKWYKNEIGGQYIPVVESGKSFRDKFTRLEDAMNRKDIKPQNNYGYKGNFKLTKQSSKL